MYKYKKGILLAVLGSRAFLEGADKEIKGSQSRGCRSQSRKNPKKDSQEPCLFIERARFFLYKRLQGAGPFIEGAGERRYQIPNTDC